MKGYRNQMYMFVRIKYQVHWLSEHAVLNCIPKTV